MDKGMMKLVFAAIAVPAVLCGESLTFPGSGGDLASTVDWNRVLPGPNDYVTLDKAGVYTLSSDLAITSLYTHADGIVLRPGPGRLLAGKSVYGNVANGTITYDGGTIVLGGTAVQSSFSPVQASASGMSAVLTNGCVVTNTYNFYATSYASSSRLVVTGGSRIHSTRCYLSSNGGTGDSLEILNGAKVYIDTFIYSDSGGTAGIDGNTHLLVSGSGSLLHTMGGNLSGSTVKGRYFICAGNQRKNNRFTVTDGAVAESEYGGVAFNVGENTMLVDKGATASFPLVDYFSSGNRTIVSNATLTCSFAFCLATNASESVHNPNGYSNNVLLVTGPYALFEAKGPDLFGTGHHNAIRVEGGATLRQLSSLNGLMSQTCRSRFVVSGPGTTAGKANSYFNVGVGATAVSSNNLVSVEDGAELLAQRMYLEGVANELCVSNATVSIVGGNIALYVGSRDAGTPFTNNVVTLCGATPKITVSDSTKQCRFYGGSTLRFRVPRKGYAADYVPFDVACGFEMDSFSALELDCAEWAARTGGTLHLIKSSGFQDAIDSKGTTIARLRATVLPPDCTLTVSSGNVYLKCPRRKGMTINIH